MTIEPDDCDPWTPSVHPGADSDAEVEDDIENGFDHHWEGDPNPSRSQHFLAHLPANFVPAVDELKVALDFIQATEAADLENGDLDPASLAQLRNPPQETLIIEDENELLSLKYFLATIDASQHTYINLRNVHNERYPADSLLSYDQIKKRAEQWSGIQPMIHHMCPNSCVAYTGPYASLDKCPECGESRYDPFQLEISGGKIKSPRQKLCTIPLGPQIQALWRNPSMAVKMMHRRIVTKRILEELQESNGIIPVYDDLYHGSEYLEACIRNDIKPDDTVMMGSMDGAQLYRDKQSDCWIFIWIFMDLSPDLRYKKAHVMPGAIVPGPSKPKKMDSFLFPTFHHIAALQKEGLTVWNSLKMNWSCQTSSFT